MSNKCVTIVPNVVKRLHKNVANKYKQLLISISPKQVSSLPATSGSL